MGAFGARQRRAAEPVVEVLPMDAAARARLERARRLAWLLDSAFKLPGTSFRFGLDPLIGLIPGAGDVVTALLSLVVLYNAARLGVSRVVQLRMGLNILLYSALGAIPVFGDAWDFFFKSNQRNMALLDRHLRTGDLAARRSDWLFVAGMAVIVVLLVAIPIAILVGIAWLLLHGIGALSGGA